MPSSQEGNSLVDTAFIGDLNFPKVVKAGTALLYSGIRIAKLRRRNALSRFQFSQNPDNKSSRLQLQLLTQISYPSETRGYFIKTTL